MLQPIFLCLLTGAGLVGSYIPSRNYRIAYFQAQLRALSTAISSGVEDTKTPFDMDFAEAMSKPLPEWYLAQKSEREKLLKEVEDNRERIVREFRAKYEVKEEVKEAERKAKWNFLDTREKRRDAEAKQKRRNAGISVGADGDVEEDEKTTKARWEKFWEDEEQSTGFYLPGFFEVFPELQLKWPNWAKRKGQAIECETDADCQFPQACCPHPIIPGDKFCCTGWTQRIMVPAYAKQTAATDRRTRDEADEETLREEQEKRVREGLRPWQPTDQ